MMTQKSLQSLAMLLSSVKKLLSPQLLIIYPILVCNKVYCQSYTWTNISVAQNNLHRSWKLERCRRASPGELILIQLKLIKLSMIIIINCRRIRSRKCWKCEFNLTLGGCFEERIQYQLLSQCLQCPVASTLLGYNLPGGWLVITLGFVSIDTWYWCIFLLNKTIQLDM